jgi:hypothetical protein
MDAEVWLPISGAVNVFGDRRGVELAVALAVPLLWLWLERWQIELLADVVLATFTLSPAKLFTTKPQSAALGLGVTESERSSALCPGPGQSTLPLTTSPPRSRAISCNAGRRGFGIVASSLANSLATG